MYEDRGIAYVNAWPTQARGTALATQEVDYYTAMTAAAGSAEHASWYGAKALKWGASPEQVARALVAVAS